MVRVQPVAFGRRFCPTAISPLAFVVGAQRVGPGRRPSGLVISPHASLVCAQRLASVLFSFEGGGGFGVKRSWTCLDRGRLFRRGVTRAKAAAMPICPSGRVVIAAYRTMCAAGGGF